MHTIYTIYAYSILLLLVLPFTLLICFIPSLKLRRRIARRVGQLFFFLVGIKIDTHGFEHIPSDTCIVIANHSSYLDGVILSAVLPPRFSFVIKKEVTAVPVLHLLLRKMGSQFVERVNRAEAANHLKKMIRIAESGQSVAIFPEGTFRQEPGLRKFQNGAFAVAHKTNLPLVPIFIDGARIALPADNWKLKRHPIFIRILPSINNGQDYQRAQDLKDSLHSLFSDEVGHI